MELLCSLTSETSIIFLIKKKAANKRPTSIATVKSIKIVITKVTNKTVISDFWPLKIPLIAGNPAIFHETLTKTAANAAIGM